MSIPNIEAAAKTLSIGCKLPNGLHLDLKDNSGELVRHTLNGANATRIIGGYGITHNIPADFMAGWLKKNAKHPAVVKGLIFTHTDAISAESIAKERREAVSGLEPIDPIKNGMLKNESGNIDSGALAKYNEAKATNPERNRQQVE